MTDDALEEAYERALAHEKAGRIDAAADAWRAVLALDPADPGGAAVRLAALGRGEAPDRAPPAYVATLFDQHADVFDSILVDQLGYAAPMEARARLDALGLGPFDRMLDLGCGTGLAAIALEDRAAHRTGVDLSERMIEVAGEDDLYDELYVAEAVHFLRAHDAPGWDLIAATDVMPYLGDPGPFFAAAAARMVPGGVFVFTTETLPAAAMGGAGWRVTPHHRFAHDPAHVAAALAAAGLEVVEITGITVRRELGAPIAGHMVVARRPGPG